MKYVKLNNGIEMPQLGFGTFNFKGDDEAEIYVLKALKTGFRLIDTAHAYLCERGVGRAIAKSGVKREEIFLTSKLWPTEYEDAENAIDKMLARLNTPYLDLLLLHQAVGNYKKAYRAMEKAVQEGKVKSIGLSDFDYLSKDKYQEMIDFCQIKPAVHQIECHPYYQQRYFEELGKKSNTQIECWFPLGGAGAGNQELLNDKTISTIGEKYGKTNAQVILRWHIQTGYVAIPKSSNNKHIEEDFDIFDFELSDEEMKLINNMDCGKRFYIPGSLEDLEKMCMSFPFSD